jgi:hypothetical protein
MRPVVVRAGDRVRLIRKRSGSIPRTFRIRTERLDDGGPISGVIEIYGSRWLFKKPPIEISLAPEVAVYKGFWDTLFSVFVVPDQDVRVSVG